MDAMTSLTEADNQIAAAKTEAMLNREDVKNTLSKLATMGSGVYNSIANGIKDISQMDDAQVQEAVHDTFNKAKESIQYELDVLNGIPSFRGSMKQKNLEEGIKTFISIEKEILENKELNIVRRILTMFWTGIKYICGLLVKGLLTAGKFVAVYGIKVIAVALDFIIQIVQKTAKFFKNMMRVVQAVRVSLNGEETPEIIDVEARVY